MKARLLAAALVGGPEGFRRFLEERGPTFFLLGRFLALRPGLMSDEYRRELMDLSGPASAFPWDEAVAILTQELGDPSAVFESIDPNPVAILPLSQVYKAVTAGGRMVAVKILRPHVEESVRLNPWRARLYARLIPRLDSSLNISASDLAGEFDAFLVRQLDLATEMTNIERLAGLASANPNLRVPRVHPELSTSRVLTTEYLGGIPLSNILSPARRSDLRLADREFDPHHFARNLMRSMLEQMFEYRFFNPDVHPRNLLFFPGNAVGFAEFGLCDELDHAEAREQVRFFGGMHGTDPSHMLRSWLELLVPGDNADLDGLREAFIDASHQWLKSQPSVKLSRRLLNGQSPTASWIMAVVAAARQNSFHVPSRVLGVCQTLITVEEIGYSLDPAASLQAVGREFFQELRLDEVFQFLKPEVQRDLAIDWLTAFRDAPEYVNQLLGELAGGRFTINLSTTRQSRAATTRDRRSRIVVAAIASVGVAGLLGESGLAVAAMPARGLVIVLLTLLYLYILLQWKRLR